MEAYGDLIVDARCPAEQVDNSKQRGELAAKQTFAFRVVERVDTAYVVDGYEDIST